MEPQTIKARQTMDSSQRTLTRDRQKEKENKLLYSYMTLRNFVGFSGIVLPVALVLAAIFANADIIFEPSISDYYYTRGGDLLVAILFLIGIFLFTYRGYNILENVLSSIAAICGIGVAFSPTSAKNLGNSFSVHTPQYTVPKFFGLIEMHLVYAALFFIILGAISYFAFTKSDKGEKVDGKLTPKGKRNIIYRVCGVVMVLCIIVIGIYFVSGGFKSALGDFPFVFFMETLAIWAFGISWATKGETLFPDGEHYVVTGCRMVIRGL
jgi:hypothetical protein